MRGSECPPKSISKETRLRIGSFSFWCWIQFYAAPQSHGSSGELWTAQSAAWPHPCFGCERRRSELSAAFSATIQPTRSAGCRCEDCRRFADSALHAPGRCRLDAIHRGLVRPHFRLLPVKLSGTARRRCSGFRLRALRALRPGEPGGWWKPASSPAARSRGQASIGGFLPDRFRDTAEPSSFRLESCLGSVHLHFLHESSRTRSGQNGKWEKVGKRVVRDIAPKSPKIQGGGGKSGKSSKAL